MIERFYTNTVTVTRLTYDGDNKGTYSTVATIKGYIQQASAFVAAQTASVYTLSCLLWTYVDSNIAVNDKVTISGINYSVKGIWKNDTGENQHLECHLERLTA
jgi:phage major head subunit gpT-like protein